MKRIYHDYRKWECFHNGMYIERKGEEREPYIQLALSLLRSPKLLRYHMESAAKEWHFSAQNHMTCRSCNRQAYLGQVACCHAHGVGESETREAWKFLTEEERVIANGIADDIINLWEGWYLEHEKGIRG